MVKFKVGDIAFFKKAKATARNKAEEVAFKGGHCFGIVLGIVPPFGQDPKHEHLMTLMGQAGFLSFDDVANFLGEDRAREVIKKFEEKYYGPILEKAKKSPLILPNSTKDEEPIPS